MSVMTNNSSARKESPNEKKETWIGVWIWKVSDLYATGPFRNTERTSAEFKSAQTVQSMSNFPQWKKCTVKCIFLIFMKDALLSIFCTEESSTWVEGGWERTLNTDLKSHCPAHLKGWNVSISAHFSLFVHKIKTDRSESFLQVFPAL